MSTPGAKVRRPLHKPWFFWFALVVGMLVASAFVFAAFCGGVSSTVGWDASPRGHAWFITTVDPHGPAAGKLAPGDQVLTIDGSTRATEFGRAADLAAVGAGNTYRIEVRRNGAIRAYSLQIALARLRPRAVVSLLVSILLFAVGLWIGLMKPDQPTTQAGFGAFMLGTLLFLSDSMSAFAVSLNRTALFTVILIARRWRPFELPLGYDFASRFPSSVPESGIWRLLRISLYAAAIGFWIPTNLPLLADALYLPNRSALLPSWFPLEAFDQHYATLNPIFYFTVNAAMCFALVR